LEGISNPAMAVQQCVVDDSARTTVLTSCTT
jgi:hypothetical protein